MAVATAAAAVPVATKPLANASDRGRWDAALAHYRRIDAEYDRICDAADAAGEAVAAAHPREDRFFDEYDLGMGMSRDRAVHSASYSIFRRELRDRPLPDAAAARAEAQRVADEFMAYQAEHQRLQRLHHLPELEKQVKAYRPRYWGARDALMRVPAPDTDALLVKMEIAAMSLDDEHAESALADAKRLLARRA
jgi:hypothetical protein